VISGLFKISVKLLPFNNIPPKHPGLPSREIVPGVTCGPVIPNHKIALGPTVRKSRQTLVDGIKQDVEEAFVVSEV
jgi:hypothetical protein